jgi:hypothetical protein
MVIISLISSMYLFWRYQLLAVSLREAVHEAGAARLHPIGLVRATVVVIVARDSPLDRGITNSYTKYSK